MAFDPSSSARVVLVDPDGVPYALAGILAMGSFEPSNQAKVLLVDPDGTPYKANTGSSGIDATIIITGVATLTFTAGILTAVTPA
jgi:hypothetical protein